MSVDELRALPIAEKLKIVEMLWDDIAATEEPIVLQPSQFQEAQRRSDELKTDPSLAIDREELWRRVDG